MPTDKNLKLILKTQLDSTLQQGWIPFFKTSAIQHVLSICLLLAIASRETGIKNIKGDGGHGRGIMQVDDRFHDKFLNANKEGLDPKTNIEYAASLLSDYLDMFDRDLVKGVAAYNCGPGNVRKALKQGLKADTYTTNMNYGEDVLKRMKIFEELINETTQP